MRQGKDSATLMPGGRRQSTHSCYSMRKRSTIAITDNDRYWPKSDEDYRLAIARPSGMRHGRIGVSSLSRNSFKDCANAATSYLAKSRLSLPMIFVTVFGQ
ncbi:hypothetical protein WN48_08368 [Eufriesea mexicana]|nr:hypothetical protein WN48_08368 [Eufriesea mexicana]